MKSKKQIIEEQSEAFYRETLIEITFSENEEKLVERSMEEYVKQVQTYVVVKKLIGEIKPIGESHEDERRLQNLEAMIYLLEHLHDDMISTTP